MAGGVDLHQIKVDHDLGGKYVLKVTMTVAAENEFEAIGWLIDALGKDV